MQGGILDDNGSYGTKHDYLNAKYSDEVRLGVGVAMVQLPSGQTEGRRAECFDYSGKVIISIKIALPEDNEILKDW